jgi:hypothetical protein
MSKSLSNYDELPFAVEFTRFAVQAGCCLVSVIGSTVVWSNFSTLILSVAILQLGFIFYGPTATAGGWVLAHEKLIRYFRDCYLLFAIR